MKPMELKAPSPCCKSPTLSWDPDQGIYVCPCGQMRVNSVGQVIRRRFNQFDCRSKKHRP